MRNVILLINIIIVLLFSFTYVTCVEPEMADLLEKLKQSGLGGAKVYSGDDLKNYVNKNKEKSTNKKESNKNNNNHDNLTGKQRRDARRAAKQKLSNQDTHDDDTIEL